MEKIIKKLPLNVILRIIPYTYTLQSKQLLDDIVNYKESKKILSDVYYNFWVIEMQSSFIETDKWWLLNDIFSYANDYNPICNGYIEKFYEIFKRNTFLQTNEKIDKYLSFLEKKNVLSQINIFLGLLSINERNEIINSQMKCWERIRRLRLPQ